VLKPVALVLVQELPVLGQEEGLLLEHSLALLRRGR
jgi:hypothetical protein